MAAMNKTVSTSASTSCGTVLIIEDDASLSWMLAETLKPHGFNAIVFNTPSAFFQTLNDLDLSHACLLLDMRLPGMSGLEVQGRLEEKKINIPIIFISGNSHISEAIAGLKNGAIDFLLKPFDDQSLINVVTNTLAKPPAENQPNIFKLTTRELLVLDYVSKGWRSEQIADALGLTVRTIKMHRSNIIHKTGAGTITEAALLVMNAKA